MKNITPAILDRLEAALSKQRVKLKRNRLLEVAAAAFGFRNSNEFTAAAADRDLPTLAVAAPIGRISLPGGESVVLVRDELADAPYAIDETFLEQVVAEERRERIGISPYGHLIDLSPALDAQIPTITSGAGAPTGEACVTLETLTRLVAAAQSYCDHVNTGVENPVDEDNSDISDIKDAIAAARARIRTGSPVPPPQSEPAPGFLRIYRATISHNHGSDDFVATSQDRLYADLAEYCRQEWHEVCDWPDVPSSPDCLTDHEAVDCYFEAMSNHEGEESLDTDVTEVELPRGMALAPSSEARAMTAMTLQGKPADWAIQIADALESGASSDIWYDAHEFGGDAEGDPDRKAEEDIDDTQSAMIEAARILRGLAPPAPEARNVASVPAAAPIYITDADGDLTGQVSTRLLRSMGLPFHEDRGTELPLTENEYERLGAGTTLNGEDLPVTLGFSVLWKGRKWIAPEIEFGWDESQPDPEGTGFHTRDAALARAHAYVEHLRTDVERLGGTLVLTEDATEFAHELAVLLPFEMAHAAASPDDWFKALAHLLASPEKRARTRTVTAEFTAQVWIRDYAISVDPQGDTVWDATFDALMNGRERARRIAKDGIDADDYRDSPFAPDWVRDWSGPFEVDLIGLDELYDL